MVAFDDVTALVIAYLAPILNPVLVATRVPDTRPDELIQVRHVGGPALPPLRLTYRFDVFAWAQTEPRAAQLGGYVRSAVWALPGTDALGITCYQVGEFKGPSMTQDEETRIPQDWATYDLVVRAEAVVSYT